MVKNDITSNEKTVSISKVNYSRNINRVRINRIKTIKTGANTEIMKIINFKNQNLGKTSAITGFTSDQIRINKISLFNEIEQIQLKNNLEKNDLIMIKFNERFIEIINRIKTLLVETLKNSIDLDLEKTIDSGLEKEKPGFDSLDNVNVKMSSDFMVAKHKLDKKLILNLLYSQIVDLSSNSLELRKDVDTYNKSTISRLKTKFLKSIKLDNYQSNPKNDSDYRCSVYSSLFSVCIEDFAKINLILSNLFETELSKTNEVTTKTRETRNFIRKISRFQTKNYKEGLKTIKNTFKDNTKDLNELECLMYDDFDFNEMPEESESVVPDVGNNDIANFEREFYKNKNLDINTKINSINNTQNKMDKIWAAEFYSTPQIQKGYLKNKILDYSSFEDDDNIDDNVNDANNNINTEEKANVFIINTDGKNGSADTKLSTKEGRTSDLDLEESKNGIIEDTLNHGYVDLSINDDYYLDGTKEIIYNIDIPNSKVKTHTLECD